MKREVVLVIITLTLLLPGVASSSLEHIEYTININDNGSALWQIIQVTDLETQSISVDELEQKLDTLIVFARNISQRDMHLDPTSIEVNTQLNWETSSKTVVYQFLWENLSEIRPAQIIVGDVFDANTFINLFGEGELFLTFPHNYTALSANSALSEINNESGTLHWYRTQDFIKKPRIELILNTETENIVNQTTLIGLIIISVGLIVSSLAFLNHRKKLKTTVSLQPRNGPSLVPVDSKEEILKLLKVSGGNIKQSEICNKLRYSRAKTSIILAEMEKNNQIRRNKIGKNKIVYMVE
jgi:uncharacterized membrane protein